MLTFILVLCATVLVLPLIILWHELGHAVVPLFKQRGEVTITVGHLDSGLLFSFRLGQVQVRVQRLFFGGGFCEFPPLNQREEAWSLAGGPLASGVLLASCLGMSSLVAEQPPSLLQPFWQSLTWTSALQLVITALPLRYPTWLIGGDFVSDGQQLLELFRRSK